jgi:hypothetical protein
MSNKSLGCLTAIALVIIAVITVPVLNFSNDHKYTVTITDKERVTTQFDKDNIDSKYLIYGEDENGQANVADLAEYMGKSEKTVRRYIKEHGGFWIDGGEVGRKDTDKVE